MRAGAVQVGINPMYTPRELEHQLNDAGCKVIIIFNGATQTLAEVLERTSVETVIAAELGDGLSAAATSLPIDASLQDTTSFSATLTEGAELSP